MTTKQMNDLVDRYLDSKGLSNPSIRKRAARKVLGYMDTTAHSCQVANLRFLMTKALSYRRISAIKVQPSTVQRKVSSTISMNWPDLQLANLLSAMP